MSDPETPNGKVSEPSDFTIITKPADQALSRIALGGLIFLLLSAVSFGASIFVLVLVFYGEASGVPIMSREGEPLANALLDRLQVYIGPLIAFAIGLATAGLGYALLRTAGTASREVLPKQDYALLSKMLLDGNHDALSEYIRLGSLSGWIGAFTKLGITGLPLATIGLTIFFTIIGLLIPTQSTLFDLAKLTLGAFIGSYVQRQGSDLSKTFSAASTNAKTVRSTGDTALTTSDSEPTPDKAANASDPKLKKITEK